MPVCTYVCMIMLCVHTHAHLSVHLGLPPLLCCLCMYVVTTIILTSDVLTPHFQVMFTFCTVGFVYETSFSLEPMTVFPHLLIIIFCVMSCFICVPCGQKSVVLYKIYILHMPVLTWETLYLHITVCF